MLPQFTGGIISIVCTAVVVYGMFSINWKRLFRVGEGIWYGSVAIVALFEVENESFCML